MSKGSEVTLCVPVTSFLIFNFIMSLVPITLIIPVLCYGIFQSLKLKIKLLKIIYWISSIISLMACIAWPLHICFDFNWSSHCSHLQRISITAGIATTSYMLSLICLCCLYSFRILLAFKNTKHTLSKWIIILLIFSILIQCLLTSLTTYFDLRFWIELKRKTDHGQNSVLLIYYQYHTFLAFSLFGALNIAHNISLLLLFLSKIYKVSQDINQKYHVLIDNIIEPAVICTICLCIAFISSSITFIFGWCRGNVIVDTNNTHHAHLTVICWDIFMNTLSITMQFKSGHRHIKKYCRCCTKCLMKCFLKRIMENDNVNNSCELQQINTNSDQNGTTKKNVIVNKSKISMTGNTTTGATSTIKELPQYKSITTFDKDGPFNI